MKTELPSERVKTISGALSKPANRKGEWGKKTTRGRKGNQSNPDSPSPNQSSIIHTNITHESLPLLAESPGVDADGDADEEPDGCPRRSASLLTFLPIAMAACLRKSSKRARRPGSLLRRSLHLSLAALISSQVEVGFMEPSVAMSLVLSSLRRRAFVFVG